MIIKAVDGISLSINDGEILGLVGESGSGKSTIGRCILGLEKPDRGNITYNGIDVWKAKKSEKKEIRKNIQAVFQDPYSSLDPRLNVHDLIAEPLQIQGFAKGEKLHQQIYNLLHLVGLSAELGERYPHQLSGGQRQRVCIARSLGLNPKFIVADEPVSSLDVSIQAQILNLIKDLQRKLRLTILFISHDMGVIRYVSDRVAVMYAGKIVEVSSKKDLFASALHPYTKLLLATVPKIPRNSLTEQAGKSVSKEVPNLPILSAGCRFHPRCPFVQTDCRISEPQLKEWRLEHFAACNYAEKIADNTLS